MSRALAWLYGMQNILHGPCRVRPSIISLQPVDQYLKAKAKMNPPDPKPPLDLADLRREIDAVDDQILGLLLRRFDLGASVAVAKRNMPPAPNMRPAREAEILRRLAARWRGPAPVETMVAIWRQIISTVLKLQGPFTVHVSGDGSKRAPTLAANHFVSGTDFQVHDTFEQVLNCTERDIQSIAILEIPDGHPPSPWWTRLHTGRLRIVGRVPFTGASQHSAFVVASQDAGASGDDVSVFHLGGAGRPWVVVHAMLSDMQISGRLLASDGDQYLFEIDGFADVESATTGAMRNLSAAHGMDLYLIGAYARPMNLAKDN